MKNKIIVSLIMFSSILLSNDKWQIQKPQPLSFNGKVKYIKEISYDMITNFGDYSKDSNSANIEKHQYFNKEKIITKEFDYNYKGEIFYEVNYTYNIYNNLIESKWNDKEGVLIKLYAFTYDSLQNLVEYKEYNSDGILIEKFNYHYDEFGKETERIKTRSGGHIDLREISKYSRKGYLKEKKLFSMYGNDVSAEEKKTYFYNRNGNVKTIFDYNNVDEDREYISTITNLKYNSKEGISQKKINKSESKVIYKYDDNGNNYEIIYSQENNYSSEILQKQINKFDDYGNITEVKIYQNNILNRNILFEYTYDKENNWIKKIEYNNKIPIKVLEREIKYY